MTDPEEKTPTNAERALIEDAPCALRRMYQAEQEKLIAEMKMTDGISHAGDKGRAGEETWLGILERYLPNRFQAQSGIVLDSDGSKSDQIDIVIHDRHFTPPVLGQGSHTYILAEAVYAVFEVKQKLDKSTLGYAADKAASVRRLHRTSVSMIASGRKVPPRGLFPIVGGLLTRSADWAGGLQADAFASAWRELEGDELRRLDCGLALEDGCFDCFPDQPWEQHPEDPRRWPRELNRRGPDAGLIYFLFRLLGWLNTIGTVPAVDWGKYAQVFQSAPADLEPDASPPSSGAAPA